MNVVLLGPPGAGKGTQATKISREFGLVHLSSGDILRAERKAKTALGRQAQDYMDRGALVPDDLILSMMMDHIARPDATNGFLLDGFPRTLAQAEGLDARLAESGRPLDVVVNMEVDDADVTRRLTGRWSCPTDGRIYQEMYSPPKAAGVCDDCGSRLTRRQDDEPEVVTQRLSTYHQQTKPLVDYYSHRGLLKRVDASGTVEDVGAAMVRACRG